MTDEDHEIYLQSPFTRKDIIQKLRKVKNNLPNPDKIKYIHLTIVGAVHRLVICKLLKESKVILIYKKGFRDNPANFRPICLLNMMYKMYSRILASKLINVSKENNNIFPVLDTRAYFCRRIGNTRS